MGGSAEAPLRGRTVVVTRATSQSSSLVERLVEVGAEVVAAPVIAIADASDGGAALRDAVAELDRWDWIVVTSANGAERLLDAVGDVSRLEESSARVAVIGRGTAEAASRRGAPVELLPERFVAEGLLEVFPPAPPGGGRVLLAQAAGARPVLHHGLVGAGWDVHVAEPYRTVHPPLPPEVLEAAVRADAITFTSASTVRGYVGAGGVSAVPPVVATIGPVTSAAARDAGLVVDVEASEHTIPGLMSALVAHLGSLPSDP